jgi:hypothetical protein
MGGTGVASARSVHAPQFNPALLTQWGKSEKFGLSLPQVVATAADKDDLLGRITDFVDADYIDTFEANIDNIRLNVAGITSTEAAINTAINAVDVTNLTTSVNNLNTSVVALNSETTTLVNTTSLLTTNLSALSNRALSGNFEGTMAIAFPSDDLAFALTLTGKIHPAGVLTVSGEDLAQLTNYTTAINSYSAELVGYSQAASAAVVATTALDAAITANDFANIPALTTAVSDAQTAFNTQQTELSNFSYGGSATPLDSTDGEKIIFLNGELASDADEVTFTSSAQFIALGVTEMGLSISKRFSVGRYSFSVGITPKLQRFDFYDLTYSVESSDDVEFDDIINDATTETAFNMDLGFAQSFGEKDEWKVGLVVKNLITQELTSALGTEIEMGPQIRVGSSYTWNNVTFAADYDVTENDAIAFGGKSQYLMLGMEWDALNTFQFRVGYRSDLSNTGSDSYTAGMGFSVFAVQLDMAAFANTNAFDNEAGIAMGFGVEW